ncbi:hypothetical protein SLA2020_085250 [Shorea laevis]
MHGNGDYVTDRDLVLRTITGLDQAFSVAKRTIPQRTPFPTFLELRSLLLIEEANLQRESQSASWQLSSINPQLLQTMGVSSNPQIFYAGSSNHGGRWAGRNNRGGRNRGSRGRFGGSRQQFFDGNRNSYDGG